MDSNIVVWTFWTAVRQSVAVCVSFSSMYQEIRQQRQASQFCQFVSPSANKSVRQFASLHRQIDWCQVSAPLAACALYNGQYPGVINYVSINMEYRLSVCLRVALSATSWLISTPSRTFVRCNCKLSGSRLLRCRRLHIQLKCDVDGNVSSSRLLLTATFSSTR